MSGFLCFIEAVDPSVNSIESCVSCAFDLNSLKEGKIQHTSRLHWNLSAELLVCVLKPKKLTFNLAENIAKR